MLKEDTKNSIVNVLDKMIFGFLVIMTLLLTNSYIGVRNAIYIILILLFLKFLINPGSLKIRFNKNIMLSLVVFWLVLFSVSVFMPYPQTSFQRIITFFVLPTIPLFLFSNLIKNKKQLIIILVALSISMSIVDLVIIWKGLNGVYRPSIFVNSLIYAFVATPLLPLFLLCALNKTNLDGKFKNFFLAAFILTAVALIFNASRGALLVASIVLIPYVLVNYRHNKKVLGSLVFLGFLFLAITLSFPPIKDRLLLLFDMQTPTNSERILMWQSALKMIADYPIFGIGLSSFNELHILYKSSLSTFKSYPHVHNVFLQQFVETGIVGFTALIYLFFTVLKTLWEGAKKIHYENRYLFTAGFLGALNFMLIGLADYPLTHVVPLRIFWTLIGICLAVSFWENSDGKDID